MSLNRQERRKREASANKITGRRKKNWNEFPLNGAANPIEVMKSLEEVQKNAPINFHISTMYSGIKVGDLDFLPLYRRCMESTNTLAPSWKIFRRIHRALILSQYFDYSLSIPGYRAECGVFRGFSALLTNQIAKMRNNNWTGENYYLVDSYEGLSQPEIKDAIGFRDEPNGTQVPLISHQPGAFATPIEYVKEKLKEFPGLQFQKGWIPEVFMHLPDKKWSFVHIDVDLYRPTIDSLEYFFPRMAKGGIIINDDFSSPLFPGGGSGWTDFFNKEKKSFIALDTGQAVYIHE